MKITVIIPDEMLGSFCEQFGYRTQTLIDGKLVDNPETPGIFAEQRLNDFVDAAIISHRANAAQDTARMEAVEAAKADIIIAKGKEK